MAVTFCGHSDLTEEARIKDWLYETTMLLISQGTHRFLLGGYGRFDSLAASVVWEQKSNHPWIESILVLPYLNHKMDVSYYDHTIYPPLESVPRRYAIIKRNEWMVDQSDTVVSYVIHSWGGAAKTLAYAKRRCKRILNYPDL